ncbi:hypothetical protein [Ralstonia holmesii]|uniref:hypothetical protein n=1 Tax=Ralstonia holmesii TaxID=3058602 RepID=UPI003F167120
MKNTDANLAQVVAMQVEHGIDTSNLIGFYQSLFTRFGEHLLRESPVETAAITSSIKAFFHETFSRDYEVLLSGERKREYLTDVLVTTFSPTKVLSRGQPFTCHGETLHALLAVESELGGESASSPGPLMRNVVEDYLKLLLIRSKYRVMVFTSLPYAAEFSDHVVSRAKTLRDLYSQADGITGGALLIHLDGANLRATSNQVKVTVGPGKIRGFVISSDGSDLDEIRATPEATQSVVDAALNPS